MDTTRLSLLRDLNGPEHSTAWREFDVVYRPMLYRFVHACGVAGTNADDVVQECMTAIVQHVARFNPQTPRGSFRAWLRRMVVNRVINLQRDTGRELNGQSRQLRRAAADDPTPEQVFDQLCQEEQLRYCLAQIREEVEPSTFEAFRMHVLEDEPVEAVCRALQMTANQVYKIKWRLTRKIAERMEALDV